jgi:hypothetical protein
MFFVSFHGGKKTTQVPDPINNVNAYDDDGNPKATDILQIDSDDAKSKKIKLDELRGLYLDSSTGTLFVVNGSKDTSNILCFTGSGTSYASPSVFASADTTPAINHPFAAACDGKSTWYVSNQDTNVVAALTAQSGQAGATAAPLGAYLGALYPAGTFLAGTLIASAVGGLSDATVVPAELGGLAAQPPTGKVQNSVRDVQLYQYTFNGQSLSLLFVVDEAASLVRIYDPATGQPLRCSNPLPASPTHLLINQNTIYAGVGSQVFSSPIPNPYDPNAPAWVFTPISSLGTLPGAVSGMAFDSAGCFHVAVRTKNQVLKFDATFSNPTPWPAKMTDNPEFLLYIPD